MYCTTTVDNSVAKIMLKFVFSRHFASLISCLSQLEALTMTFYGACRFNINMHDKTW